jgi:ParB-like chromosome segregation protein Spo0J
MRLGAPQTGQLRHLLPLKKAWLLMKVVQKQIETLIPYAANPRVNAASVAGVAASIKEFGFQQPIVIDAEGVVIAGHTRLQAAFKLGLSKVPCVVADELTPAQIKAYRLLDNKLAEKIIVGQRAAFNRAGRPRRF